MPEGFYYFGCTVSFDCPICGRCSSEKLVCEARSPDPERVARFVSRQSIDCQLCGAAQPDRQKRTVQVLCSDLRSLQRLCFTTRQAA